MYSQMKAIYALYLIVAVALAFTLVSCGKKESTETAPAKATPAAPAAAIDTANAGSVGGGVKLDGAPPGRKKINMAAEPVCAAEHANSPAMDEEVVTGAGGALENVIVYVKEGVPNASFPTPSEAATIDQKGCQY